MAVSPELRALVDRQNGIAAAMSFAAFAKHFYTDPAFSEIKRSAARTDAKWNGQGWKPSELATIGYCVLKSGRNPASARAFLDGWLATAGGSQ